jgi:hypothetical protein
VTTVPFAKVAVHWLGQLIPAGLLVIVPWFAAGPVTVNWNVEGGGTKPLHPVKSSVDTALNEAKRMMRSFMARTLLLADDPTPTNLDDR